MPGIQLCYLQDFYSGYLRDPLTDYKRKYLINK